MVKVVSLYYTIYAMMMSPFEEWQTFELDFTHATEQRTAVRVALNNQLEYLQHTHPGPFHGAKNKESETRKKRGF